MKKILVLYDGTTYTYKWVKTLFWAKDEFQNRGYKLVYLNYKSFLPIQKFAKKQVDDFIGIVGKKKYDIIFIAYHYSISKIESRAGLDRIGFLKLLRNTCNKIVWLDTADSTGNCQFDVMPYVDVYLKKQLLRDKTLYTKKLYGSKLYTDYYHDLLNIDDESIDNEYVLLNLEDINKLKASWNIGISDFWARTRRLFFRPFKIAVPEHTSVKKERKTFLFFNGTMNYSPLSGFQRRKVIELMESDERTNKPAPTAKMNHHEYVNFMKSTKAAISPFGWGEICYRDFESFVYGATLLKPDMSVVETYPNFFIEHETYIPIRWDFDDYDSIIEKIGSKHYEEVAQKGQNMYMNYLTSSFGKQDFVNHIIDVIS